MSIKQSVLKTFPPFPCASYNFRLFGVTLEYMKENLDSFASICSILLSKAIERGRQACTSSCLEKKKVSFYQCKKNLLCAKLFSVPWAQGCLVCLLAHNSINQLFLKISFLWVKMETPVACTMFLLWVIIFGLNTSMYLFSSTDCSNI